MSNVFSQLNKHYSLNDFVTLSEISTEKDKRKAEKAGYNVGFTKEEWRKKFPSIPASRVICPKSELFPASLCYYDRKGIYLPLNIFGSQILVFDNDEKKFEDALSKKISQLEKDREEKNYRRVLLPGSSEGSGNIASQQLLDLIDFYGPSPELYEAFLSFYTFSDCGCGVLTGHPQQFTALINARSEAQKAEAMKQMESLPDLITVYRGEGDESTPYEQALSWSTNITAAYFFAAWRTPKHARLLKGTVRKEDALAYITDRNESELLVIPGTVQDVEVHDCIPGDAFFDKITEHPSELSNAYEAFYYSLPDIFMEISDAAEFYKAWGHHDEAHIQHVCIMAKYLYQVDVVEKHLDAPSAEQEAIAETFNSLIRAAIWHDAGRVNELIDSNHGRDSYKIWLDNSGEEPDDVAGFLMTFHCKDDSEAEEAFHTQFKDREYSQYIWEALSALKDADALDRWRFGWGCKDFVNAAMLRSQTSRDLMLVAGTLQMTKFK